MEESSIGETANLTLSNFLNSTVDLLYNSTLINGTTGNDSCCCCDLAQVVEPLPVPKKNPKILNTDVEGFERTHLWEIFVMLGTLAALSLFAVAANGLILMVLMKNRNLRRMKNFPFVTLLIVSILTAMTYYFYIVLTYHSDFELLDKACQYFYGWAIEVLYNISLTTMLGMCIERLISVTEPLWFSTVWMENKYSLWINLAMIALGTVPCVAPLMTKLVVNHHSRKWMYCRMDGTKSQLMTYIWLNNCTIYIPSIIGVVAVYIAVQVKASQARRITRQFKEECKGEREKRFEAETGISMEKIKQCLYNSRVTIALLCIFVGTKLPIAILAYAHYFHMKLPYSVRNCEFVGNVCRFFFCVLTPFLLPLMNTPLRNKVLELVCRRNLYTKSQRSTSCSNVNNTLKSGNKTQRTEKSTSHSMSVSHGV